MAETDSGGPTRVSFYCLKMYPGYREKCVITLNEPEKGSNPRMFKVSGTFIEMLNSLSKQSEQVSWLVEIDENNVR